MAASVHVFDVSEVDFAEKVVQRSHEIPVVVDFWAAWCGPCRTLGPILEDAVDARGGEVVLAKLDTDSNQRLAAQFRIRGIPAVKAFRDGKVVAEFVGAQPARQVDAFLDQLVPTAADRAFTTGVAAADAGDVVAAERDFRRALELEPRHKRAAIALATLVVDRDPAGALTLVAPHRPDPQAEAVVAKASLASDGDGDLDALRSAVAAAPEDAEARLALGRALAAAGHHAEALDEFLAVVRSGGEARDDARERIVGLFRVLGDEDPLVVAGRRRLASALY